MNALRTRAFRLFAIIFAALLGMSGSATAASQASQAERDSDQSTWDQVTQVGMIHTYFGAVLNDLDAEAAAKLVGRDAVIQTPLGSFAGPEGFIEFASILNRANPDAIFGIRGVTVTDEGVVVDWRMSASSYSIDPNESASAVYVERSGTATLTFSDDTVSAASVAYETALSPVSSATSASLLPFPEHPGVTAF